MADLTGKEASQSVVISGANPSTGVETNYLDVDTSGNAKTVVNNASGASAVNIQDGGNSITIDGTVSLSTSLNPTYVVVASSIAIGNNKSMISLNNAAGSGVNIKITAIKILNTQTTAVTGVVSDFRLLRHAGHSGGTTITPLAYDTNDTLSASITAQTGSTTITSEAASPLNRWLKSSDEWGVGALDTEGLDQAIDQVIPLYQKYSEVEKSITIRPGQGIHIKHVVNSTAGRFDFIITFVTE